jgi:hypothetical protein
MIIPFANIIPKIGMLGVKSILNELGIAQFNIQANYLELKNDTDPAKINPLRARLEQEDMVLCDTIGDSLGVKIVMAICNIFILSEAGLLTLSDELRKKFGIEEYLLTVIENLNYDQIRRAFTDLMKVSPQQYYIRRRWEYIMYWFSLGKSVEAVSVLALFHKPSSFSNYFKSETGSYPTEYKFPAPPAFTCLKTCNFHSFCANFHICPNCGHRNFVDRN